MRQKRTKLSSFRLDIEPDSLLRHLVMGTDDEEKVRITLKCPSLEREPTARGKARVLLEAAAEVEHALMVQYLYAYFSLKDADDQHPAGMDAAIIKWKKKILGTAIEEMGHMMTVQNLLVGLGLPPNVEREDFPFVSDLYPFPYQLEPLSEKSLAKYTFAEAPLEVPPGAEKGYERIAKILKHKKLTVNHVAVLYTLLGIVFMKPGDDGSADPDGDLKRFKQSAAELAEKLISPGEEASWHLPDEAWDHPLAPQAKGTHWSMGNSTVGGTKRVLAADSRQAALIALADVSAQGEGPGGTVDGDSHFSRFFAIFNGSPDVVRFPGEGWEPVRGVPTNPTLPENATSDGDVITDSLAQAFSRVADSSYAIVLGLIQQYFYTPSSGRLRIAKAAWQQEMQGRLSVLNAFLKERPHAADGSGSAALPFTTPTPVNLPTDEAERKLALAARYNEGLKRLADLKSALVQVGESTEFVDEWSDAWKNDRDRFALPA